MNSTTSSGLKESNCSPSKSSKSQRNLKIAKAKGAEIDFKNRTKATRNSAFFFIRRVPTTLTAGGKKKKQKTFSWCSRLEAFACRSDFVNRGTWPGRFARVLSRLTPRRKSESRTCRKSVQRKTACSPEMRPRLIRQTTKYSNLIAVYVLICYGTGAIGWPLPAA